MLDSKWFKCEDTTKGVGAIENLKHHWEFESTVIDNSISNQFSSNLTFDNRTAVSILTVFCVHSKYSGTFLWLTGNVLLMLKTFGVHSKWRNIERHWKCIPTALWLLSKYSYSRPISTAFRTFWSHSMRIEMTSWYRASLSLAPFSAPTHQAWQAPSWGRFF